MMNTLKTQPTTAEQRYDLRQLSLIGAPMVLLVTMYLVYHGLITLLGMQVGLFLGMLVYWLVWCLAYPLWVVGPAELRAAFRGASPPVGPRRRLGWMLLAIPVMTAVAVGYMEVWPQATTAIILLSIPFALANGTFEEVLWRGAYVRAFPKQLILGYLYPAFGFAIWHLAPVLVQSGVYTPVEIGVGIGGALVFGLCWGWVAWRTDSIRWTVASHILVNIGLLSAAVFMG